VHCPAALAMAAVAGGNRVHTAAAALIGPVEDSEGGNDKREGKRASK
jgi:hypothetical protein